jgi:hypothetical protein
MPMADGVLRREHTARHETCEARVVEWWAEASGHLNSPVAVIVAYRTALLDQFANPKMHHRLDRRVGGRRATRRKRLTSRPSP